MNGNMVPRQRDPVGNTVNMTGVMGANRSTSVMKIVIFHLFVGSLLLIVRFDPPERHQLSRRLRALRFWPSYKNYQSGQ